MTSANTNLLKIALIPEPRMTIEKVEKTTGMTGVKEMTTADQDRIDRDKIIAPKKRTNLPIETIPKNLISEKVLNQEGILPRKIETGNRATRVPNPKTEKNPVTMKKQSHPGSKESWVSFLGSSSTMRFFPKIFI